MRNQVQLITYADRLAGSLPGLIRMLDDGPLAGLFGGVHILPFFTPFDGADAGFDPIDHRQVDPRLGDRDDVTALARNHDVVADLIVNQVSVAVGSRTCTPSTAGTAVRCCTGCGSGL
jgi:sucrose phosphorylase